MVKGGWWRCPICRRKRQKIEPDSILFETPIYCKDCKMEFFPTIFQGRELEEDEPFPLAGKTEK